MAQYQHLPIYKQTYDILLRTMTATKEFPREYKYTLGQKLKDELIELVVMIYRANSAADKARHIESIVERVQAIQLMMRLSHDMKILSRRHYAALSEMTDSLAKQAQGGLRVRERGRQNGFQVKAWPGEHIHLGWRRYPPAVTGRIPKQRPKG